MKKCETGCKSFDGGEILHHEDCVFYPESLSKIFDDTKSKNKELLDALKKQQKNLEILINLTPSGKFRNELCDQNISLLNLLDKYEK